MKTVKHLVFLLFFLPFISNSQDSLYYPVDIVYNDVAEQYMFQTGLTLITDIF